MKKIKDWKIWGRIKKHPVLFSVILLILLFIIPGFYNGLTIRKYVIEDERISGDVRIALVTDLHSCKYGKDQKTLINAIDKMKPDLVLLGGDIFDDRISDTNAETFLAGIAGRYACYYVTGNHECWAGVDAFYEKMDILEKYDIPCLSAETKILLVNDVAIQLSGIADPFTVGKIVGGRKKGVKVFEQSLEDLRAMIKKDRYTILLTHRPEYIEKYADVGYDLVLAGHAHGGQWRIPGLINGVYAPDQGLFPKYAGGRYKVGNTTMIVSRGLARESTIVPRFYNPPELVIVDLKGKQKK